MGGLGSGPERAGGRGAGPYGRGSATMADNDSHVKALSHRMLQGWKLLAQTCPVPASNDPLMRPPGEREQYECVKCGGTFAAALRRVRCQSEVTRREHHDEEMAVESEGEPERGQAAPRAGLSGAAAAAPQQAQQSCA